VAFDERLADRIRASLRDRMDVDERKMFGGIAFLINGNMCCGVLGDELIVRLEREEADGALAEDSVRPFDFTGKPMRGIVCVGPDAVAEDQDLARWLERGQDFAGSLPPK
jgi:TfoX/Sxy family transcriptional regulator of competence genes